MRKVMESSWFAPCTVLVLAMVIFSVNLDRPPHPDELHHVLAAQQLLEAGRPIIGEGEYWRGILHTWLVAISFEVFGEGLASARIPSLIAVALAVAMLFTWVRQEAGSRAAWFTTALFVTSPFTVEIAQFCRFYALQLLFFTGGSIAVFYLVLGTGNRRRALLLAALSAAFFALATWLQVTSLIGILSVVAWLGGVMLHKVFMRIATQNRLRVGLTVAVAVTFVVVLCTLAFHEEARLLWQRYRAAPLFAADTSGEYWYYYLRYHLFYPSLWPVVAVLAVFAVARSPRLGWFATVVFAITFLLTSFAAQKATRYFSYAQPYLAIVWGLGLVSVLPVVGQHIKSSSLAVIESTGLFSQKAILAARVLAVVVVATVVLANPFWLRTSAMIADVALPMETPMTDWRAAQAALAPWTDEAGILITTEELGAMYFLGRSDVRFSRSKFGELRENQKFEFGIDQRTGRPIISRPESVELLIQCFPKGFVVGPSADWGSPILIDAEIQAVIRAHAQPIAVPKTSHLFAWGWDRPAEAVKPAACATLPKSLGRNPRL